jgi:uncharacterized protein (DUF1015 family)
MVDVAPFRALRYSTPKNKSDISTLISPPYDVISPPEREALVKRSACNIVQLELPSGNEDERYVNAAAVLRSWKSRGVVQEDRMPAFYVLETTYRIKDAFAPKKALKRYGVLTALRIETPGKGAVRPHEKTLPKAKEDRLHLLNALQTNISPIFGLFFDNKKEWKSWISKITKKKPLATGSEHAALKHRLWKVDDHGLQRKLRTMLRTKELFIADGHHRYEVSWAYRESRLGQEPRADLNAGWRRTMAYVCPMEEPGLLMLPTHRLVRSSRSFGDWKKHLESVFTIKKVASLNALVALLAKPKKQRSVGWAAREGVFLLTLRSDIGLDRCLAHRPPALRELDVVLLHDIALGECSDPAFLTEREITFTRDVPLIQRSIKERSTVAFILSSPGVASLARVSTANEVMPPKTTYFYPKVPTGFTLMPLEQTIE